MGVVLLAAVGIVLLTIRPPPPAPFWAEDFDPLEPSRWFQLYDTAVWEDVPGPTASLREADPDEDFGKVESEILSVDVDAYPVLRVRATAVDQEASYTVQVLDKSSDAPTDLLAGIEYPGEHTVNLSDEMGWHGVQTFTINIWIGGEGRCATFDLVSLEAERPTADS